MNNPGWLPGGFYVCSGALQQGTCQANGSCTEVFNIGLCNWDKQGEVEEGGG